MKTKIGWHIYIILTLIVFVNQIIDFILSQNKEIYLFIIGTIPIAIMAIFSIINLFAKNDLIYSFVFLMACIITSLLSSRSELTSVIFLLFSLHKQKDIKYHIYYIAIVIICIVINNLINGMQINSFINYIIFYSGIVIFYYLDIRSDATLFIGDVKIDSQTVSVLYDLVSGYNIKDICYRSGRTYDAVSKSLERARKNIGNDATNYTLVAYCVKNGLFDKKIDNRSMDDF